MNGGAVRAAGDRRKLRVKNRDGDTGFVAAGRAPVNGRMAQPLPQRPLSAEQRRAAADRTSLNVGASHQINTTICHGPMEPCMAPALPAYEREAARPRRRPRQRQCRSRPGRACNARPGAPGETRGTASWEGRQAGAGAAAWPGIGSGSQGPSGLGDRFAGNRLRPAGVSRPVRAAAARRKEPDSRPGAPRHFTWAVALALANRQNGYVLARTARAVGNDEVVTARGGRGGMPRAAAARRRKDEV